MHVIGNLPVLNGGVVKTVTGSCRCQNRSVDELCGNALAQNTVTQPGKLPQLNNN